MNLAQLATEHGEDFGGAGEKTLGGLLDAFHLQVTAWTADPEVRPHWLRIEDLLGRLLHSFL